MKKHYEIADLKELYLMALSEGKCKTQKDFARLVGVDPAVMSTIMSGRNPITEQMYNRIANALSANGMVVGNNVQNAGGDIMGDNAQKNLSSPDIEPLISEMAAQREMYASHIDRLLGIIEKMQK